MKHQLPLELLKQLEPFVEGNHDLYVDNGSDALLRLIDKAEGSDFHFTISEVKPLQNGKLSVQFQRKPSSSKVVEARASASNIEQFSSHFGQWITLLEGYRKVKSVFDDPILEALAEDFFNHFEFIDADAEEVPLPVHKILVLDATLGRVNTVLETERDGEYGREVLSIQKDIKELRSQISKKPKGWVGRKLALVYGKLLRIGPKFFKKVIDEATSKAIGGGLDFFLDAAQGLLG